MMAGAYLSIQCEHGDDIYTLTEDGYTVHPNASAAEKDNIIRCLSRALLDTYHRSSASSPSGLAAENNRLRARIKELEPPGQDGIV